MSKDATQQIECFQCKRLFPSATMISGELIRPALAELILKRLTDWTPAKMLCPTACIFSDRNMWKML